MGSTKGKPPSTADELREYFGEGLSDSLCAEYLVFANHLRSVESADLVAAEQAYHEQKIEWLGELLAEKIEGADVAACLASDHRRKSRLCIAEIERREKLRKLPPSGVLWDRTERKQQIKERTIQVIESYLPTPLRKRGKELIGFCIFHDDKRHPNLRVSEQKKLWYCPVCGVGGDVFDFVGRAEKLTYG